jgi:tetraacyldisaccharide 4'-kinase
MRAPDFWYNPKSPLGFFLSPLGWLYDQASKFFRGPVQPEKIDIPVVCVGNITMGGAGKTPVVAEITARLREMGVDAHILSRGYGGTVRAPLKVDPNFHSSAEVGDEPLMLSKRAPVWVSASKVAGAKAAQAAGAKMIIMDDGLQNPSLHKDFSILVVDGSGDLGNEKIFPAGPLREYAHEALARIDTVIYISSTNKPAPLRVIRTPKPFLRATPHTLLPGRDLRGMPVYAFCGLGVPDKFYNGLKAQGAELRGKKSFPDHHAFSRREVENSLREAERLGATPVTTAKDATRIAPDLLQKITVCELRLSFQNEDMFEKLIGKLHGLVR